jgi:DNA-binding NarL/FixJ family response regulator
MAAEVVRSLAGDRRRTGSAKAVGDPFPELSDREQQVLHQLADGLTDREIATRLGISPRTVETHVGSILHKLGVKNRAQATRRFLESNGSGDAA